MSCESPLYRLSCLVERRYQEEYEAGLELWRDIERKAQGVVAVSGILLTALFAIVKGKEFELGLGLAWTLSMVVTSLGIALFSAFLALRTRTIGTPPQAHLLEESATRISKLIDADSADQRLAGFISDQFNDWKRSLMQITQANEKKVHNLLLGYLFVILALVLLLGATIFVVTTSISGYQG